MPPQMDEFLPPQQPQGDVERRVNELSSTVDALSRQVSNLQIEMQKMTKIAEESQSNQSVTELSSTVEELRRQLSNMQSEMQQQTKRHEEESSSWKKKWKNRAQEQRSRQSPGRVPDWLRQKILQERRSQTIRQALNQYNSTSSSSSSESNAKNPKKGSQLSSHLFQDTSNNQQNLPLSSTSSPSSSSSSSDEGEHLQHDCPPKVSNPWAHWVSPDTMNTSDKIEYEKPETDQASNYLCKTNPYLQALMLGLEENKHVILEASKNPQKEKSLSMTDDEEQQFNLNQGHFKVEKAMDASRAFLEGMKMSNHSLKSASPKNCTEDIVLKK